MLWLTYFRDNRFLCYKFKFSSFCGSLYAHIACIKLKDFVLCYSLSCDYLYCYYSVTLWLAYSSFYVAVLAVLKLLQQCIVRLAAAFNHTLLSEDNKVITTTGLYFCNLGQQVYQCVLGRSLQRARVICFAQ